MLKIIYQQSTASEAQILLHLQQCDSFFLPKLSDRVALPDYARKLFKNSITFEAWAGSELAGLLAAYFNDFANRAGFITNVSVIPNWMGYGIASKLIGSCINFAKENAFIKIGIEVNANNLQAVHLYQKFGFLLTQQKNENIMMTLDIF